MAAASLLTVLAGQAQAQVVVDGRVASSELGAGTSGYYGSMGQYTRPHSSSTGFGDWGLQQAYISSSATKLVIGVRGSVEPVSGTTPVGNFMQVYLDLPNRTGVSAGYPLPAAYGSTSFDAMNGTVMDMQTDYGLALGYNSNGSLTAQYVDYTQSASTGVSGALGTMYPSGTPSTFYSSAAQSRFYGARMAYTVPSPNLVSYNTGQAWEMELDLASLGVLPGQQVRVFVLYGSGNSGYVSTDFIPESGTTTNPGFAPNFSQYTSTQAYTYTLTGSTTGTGTYCTSSLGGGSCDIYSVQLPGATIASTAGSCPGTSSNNYSAYSSGLTVQPGQSYTMGLTTNISGESISAWADWNQDGMFSSSEYTQLSANATAYSAATATVYVPSGAVRGSTRLRVRTRAAGNPNSSTDACTTFGSGETRDYTISVGCNLTTPTVGGDGTYCVGQPVYLTASGIPSGASYNWTGPNGYVSYNSNPAFYATASNAGAYVLTVTSGSCAVTSRTVQVATTAAPTAPTTTNGSNCGPGPVTLGVSGAPSGGSYRWYSSSTSTTALATGSSFTTPYLYGSVYYYVSTVSAAGCESSRSYALASINNTPSASISTSGATTFCQGGAVSLTTSGSSVGSYQFYRNGSAISGATGSTYSATTSGNYTVAVTTTSACTSTSGSVTVTVNPGTSAAFAYATNTYCQSGANPTPNVSGTAGGTFTTSGIGLNINPYNGTINLVQSQPGSYTITYSVSGTCGSTATTTLTVSQAAQATFSYPAASYCASGSAVPPVLASGSSAGTFTASPAGLSLNASTGAVDLAQSQPGTYTVINSIATSSGCTPTSASAQLVINSLPTATLTASGPLTFCQGGTVTLTAPTGVGYSYQFFRNATAIAGATSTTYSPTAAGGYTVRITNASGCTAMTTAPTSVVVNAATTATFAYAGSTYCQGGAAIPTPTVSGTTGGAFSSTNGLALNAATGAIDLGQSQPGTYTVTYSVPGSCPSTGTTTLTVTDPASASFAYAAPSFCAGAQATAPIALASGSSAGTFTASPAGLSLSASTGTVDLAQSQPGTYTITNAVAAANGCAATTGTTVLIVNTAPAAPIVTVVRNGSTTTLTSSAPAGNQWYQNGQPVAGATANTYVANSTAQLGSYSVVVTNANGCVSPASAATIVTNALRPLAGSSLMVYPNPTPDGRLTLELTGYTKAVEVDVMNVLGQAVLHLSVPANSTSTIRQAIDLHGQASGVYLLRTRSAGNTDLRRLVLN
ncbi:Ig-like domain-containing protein [Hymenobacter siberiensis]|uniref:Ig-like domain-containing protein n=1 Tax=Hymenobacter siberiensis TaxID=2848396 RepID=UPI001C1E1DEE|nr:GEVED domain-containing protein [Hymenobacter siberiensis]MBU6122218.1 T9SS type A sorting domain-containing protein [Hymenobacter siberiensis]